ncbi:PAB-dependent poly(A)-specific ribonuclease subunit PAN3 [Microdochium trichocladiopsis]|uniref:PAN2-PAN3 deadenylation complex subunit PAN3 n=1 Tax=Microdochium trichocladiopsis TaxID=1682393 RepID=A0A9P9BJN4_9PEZI|nr:PAB-dependent poly(A)-specific ribonuclease subunit PAN3 [Microdochium trichocladiopsis]KAH7018270.1 PAB-dependent poly(A)-specific ribonuclease subunit PAN3 [Microdochium trichocladiopsis]
MASTRFGSATDRAGRTMASPRPKARDTKDTLCRNVLIYGHCRYEDQGCAFNHDQNKNSSSSMDVSKKSLNVESPSFTPAQLPGSKKTGFSTTATPFTPRGSAAATSSLPQDVPALYKTGPTFAEFTPQNYDLNTASGTNGTGGDGAMSYDPFTMSNVAQALNPASQYNPYAEDPNALSGAGAQYYGAQGAYTAPLQPLNHHLYNPVNPSRENLLPHQKQIQELFVPEHLREELAKKSEAARQVLPTSTLPSPTHYHSLVPLDVKMRTNSGGFFGFPSSVYKAYSRKQGSTFCLRRIEGYRLTAEGSFVKTMTAWKKIIHPNVVTTVEAFTTREFSDSSLIFVQHYHPLSKTLAEAHSATTAAGRFSRPSPVAERVLWSYLLQITSALRAIHAGGLAARCIDATKVIITDKNRIRLAGCSIIDVLQGENQTPLEDLQQEDFLHLGRLILSLATHSQPRNSHEVPPLLDQMSRSYSQELVSRTSWLLSPPQPGQPKTTKVILAESATHLDDIMIAQFNYQDETTSHLSKELENGRLFRLMAKLGAINERPEFDNDPTWSETNERYTLKLFRDYVFHQVDSQGNPVVDLGHIVQCLNKLDAGIDEKIYLTSRDHQSAFVVTYKELKKQVTTAFGDLLKGGAAKSKSY